MTKKRPMCKYEELILFVIRHSSFFRHWSFVIRHYSLGAFENELPGLSVSEHEPETPCPPLVLPGMRHRPRCHGARPAPGADGSGSQRQAERLQPAGPEAA